jgi:1,4-dihydroxy-2-naphthoyl-CoA hydrolase
VLTARVTVAADLYRSVSGLAADELIELVPEARPYIPPDCLLAELGMVLTHVGRGRSRVMMPVTARHLNQRGVVQAGAMVALADAAAGWAAYTALEDGGFTTFDLHCSLLRAAREGEHLIADAVPVHLGRRTLVFEVGIYRLDNVAKPIARFGCSQLVIDNATPSARPLDG